jgi:hypothetical protein
MEGPRLSGHLMSVTEYGEKFGVSRGDIQPPLPQGNILGRVFHHP